LDNYGHTPSQAQSSTASSQLSQPAGAAPVPQLVPKGVLHNELPSPMPSPRDQTGAQS